MSVVFTIGYEGTKVDTFVAVLKSVGVTLLADVRAVPLSRKVGFSKKALQKTLADAGIEYRHFIDLGDPKQGREAARRGDLDTFRRIYGQHFKTDDAQLAFGELLDLVPMHAICMLCFEREPKICHRNLIAEEMHKRGLATFDLYADDARRYVRAANKIPHCNSRQSASATEQEVR